MTGEMAKSGLKVSKARISILTNSPHLLEPDRFYWLDTNFLDVTPIPYERSLDSVFEIRDGEDKPSIKIEDQNLRLMGNFSDWEKETADLRYSLFGNLGIFSSWVLRTLEQAHDILSLHASCLVKDKKLLVIPGGAGAGKTVFILDALDRGWKLFGTEFAHFRLSESVEFFKGAVKDAVRVETLRSHFPQWIKKLGITVKEEIGSKLVVDLSSYQDTSEWIQDPEIILVFPHVEEKRKNLVVSEIQDRETMIRHLFHAASEKICKSQLLYGRMAVPGLDTDALAQKRLKHLEKFVQSGIIKLSLLWISGVTEVTEIFDRIESVEK